MATAAEGSDHTSAARDADMFHDGLEVLLSGVRARLATTIDDAAPGPLLHQDKPHP